MKRIYVSWALLFVLILLLACAAPKPPVGTKECLSGCEAPKWVDNPSKVDTRKEKAFVGVSKNWAMEQSAKSDARLDAYKQAVDATGLYGKRKLTEVKSIIGAATDIFTAGGVSDETTKLKSVGVARGEVKEYHVQHWRRYEEGGVEEYYVIYALFMMPRDAANKFMEDVLRRQRELEQAEEVQANIDRALEKIKELEAEDW